jgi:endonuclease/exonuclease/phosphatase family metal-dependent hydrolase
MFKVMTFNLRFETEDDRKNPWETRRDLVVELVTHYAPRVLGTQEGMWHQLVYLQDHLPEYTLHTPLRVIDETCQYPSIFYRTADLEVEEGGEFWLSNTPAVHRSKDWDSAFPRMMSYGRFWDRDTKERIWCMVTHLDHQGIEARQRQGEMIGDFVRDHAGPAILMGDFNDSPTSPVHAILTGPETGLNDTWQVLGREEGEQSMTHHGFRGIPQKTRMDWIVVSRHFRVLEARIIRDNRHGRYPSDHFPYSVDLELR